MFAESLVTMGCELLSRGKLDEALAALDSANLILTDPSNILLSVASKHLQEGTTLLQADGRTESSSVFSTNNKPDVYGEDECDVGPRVITTPIQFDSAGPQTSMFLQGVILFNMALIHQSRDNLSEASRCYEMVLLITQQIVGSLNESPAVSLMQLILRTHNNYGCIAYSEHKEGVSSASFEMAADISRHLAPLSSPNSLEYAAALSNYCRSRWMRGDTSDSLHDGLKEILRIRLAVLSWDNLDVASARYNVAVLEYQRRNHPAAVAELRQYLMIASHRAKSPEAATLDTIPALSYLLLIENEVKTDHKSLELVRGLRLLQDKREDVGPDSLEVATVLNLVGTHLFHLKNYEYALPFFLEELRLEESSKGEDHKMPVKVTCNNVGRILQEMGRFEEAIKFYHRALDGQAASNLSTDGGKGDFAKGLEIVVTVCEKADDTTDSLSSTVFYNLGLIHDRLGNFSEAICAFEMSLKLRRRLLGRMHPDVACLLYNIGVLQMEQQRLDDASVSFREALFIRRCGEAGQLEDRNVVKTLEKLTQLHKAKGNVKRAVESSRQILDILESSSEYDTMSQAKEMGSALRSLAELYQTTGDFEKAVQLSMDSVNKLRILANLLAQDGSSSPHRRIGAAEQLTSSLLLLGSLYHEICEPLQANCVFEEALQLVQNTTQQAIVIFGTSSVPASFRALLEVTSILAACHCAAEA